MREVKGKRIFRKQPGGRLGSGGVYKRISLKACVKTMNCSHQYDSSILSNPAREHHS